MQEIVLGSLVIAIGPSGAGKSTLLAQLFMPHEIVSSDAIRVELVGDMFRQDINDVVHPEAHRRVQTKLALGQRAVVDATNLNPRDRRNYVEIGQKANVPIYYMVINRPMSDKMRTGDWRNRMVVKGSPIMQHHEDLFLRGKKDFMNGDGRAITVIDVRRDEYKVVHAIDCENIADAVQQRGYDGFAFIGDVHNTYDKMTAAMAAAAAKNLFMVFLGDVVDYGPQPVECIDALYDAVMSGKALFILGNHEKKVFRYYEQQIAALDEGYKFNEIEPSLNLSKANLATINVINRLPPDDRNRIMYRFVRLCRVSRLHLHIANITAVHGAAHKSIFATHAFRLEGKAREYAYFGLADGFAPRDEHGNRYPNRIYDWVEDVPPTRIVIVGHDIRSTEEPLFVANSKGGRAVFADTGCGKGGRLTMLTVPFATNPLLKIGEIEQF